MDKYAVVTGVGGQDGRWLSELLLKEGWKVIGIVRRSSQPRDYLTSLVDKGLELIEGDITDFSSMERIIKKYKPNHFYNLAAQSHVGTSFDQPLYTCDVTGRAVTNILETIRLNSPETRLYQASSSEMFGKSVSTLAERVTDGWEPTCKEYETKFQDENTSFIPQSPYACAKLYAHHMVRLYRESYGLFACAGIIFNHESEHRSLTFVTRKITNYVARLKLWKERVDKGIKFPKLKLGNINSYRDWSYAPDVVKAMYMMLLADKPDDYVIGSGETHSVREFCEIAFAKIGEDWHNYVEIDQSLVRPAEVDYLRSDPSKIKKELGWKPDYSFDQMVDIMIQNDIKRCEIKYKVYGDI